MASVKRRQDPISVFPHFFLDPPMPHFSGHTQHGVLSCTNQRS